MSPKQPIALAAAIARSGHPASNMPFTEPAKSPKKPRGYQRLERLALGLKQPFLLAPVARFLYRVNALHMNGLTPCFALARFDCREYY